MPRIPTSPRSGPPVPLKGGAVIRAVLVLWAALFATATEAQTIQGRDGPITFDAPPERVVTLDWALTEQVLDLDVTPVGAPELDLYREWVGAPVAPDAVADVGLRTEPNLERIATLAPDVILASDIGPDLVAQLERIAPVVVFEAYAADHDNVAAARRIYLALADLFDRRDLAERRLSEMDAELETLASDIAAMNLPGMATAIRLNDESTVWIYGENAFPTEALRRLGLPPEIDIPATRWGVTQRPLDALAEVEEGALLAIRPHMGGAAALESPLWGALPAVRAGHFAEVERVWSYGGILSLLRHARAFHDGLSRIAP